MKSLNLFLVTVLAGAVSACSGTTNGGNGGGVAPLSDAQTKTVKEFGQSLGNVKGAGDQAQGNPGPALKSEASAEGESDASSVAIDDKKTQAAIAQELKACKFKSYGPQIPVEGKPMEPEDAAPRTPSEKSLAEMMDGKITFGFKTEGEKCPVNYSFTFSMENGKAPASTWGDFVYEVKDPSSKIATLSDITKVDLHFSTTGEIIGSQNRAENKTTFDGKGSVVSKKNGKVDFTQNGTLVLVYTGKSGELSAVTGSLTSNLIFKDFTAVVTGLPYLKEENGEKTIDFKYLLNGKEVDKKEIEGLLNAQPSKDSDTPTNKNPSSEEESAPTPTTDGVEETITE